MNPELDLVLLPLRSLMCRGAKGLLTKVVEVMKKEPTASTFRFWLARAVESYLRGSTSYCDQVFLLRRGLLQVRIQDLRDWSLITGRGGGGYKTRGGAREVLPLRKGGTEKVLAI